MFNDKNRHTVTVNWSYPIKIENIDKSIFKEEDGIYYISRQVGLCPEIVIYIGETKRTFRKRLKEHKQQGSLWTQKYGQKYVRFGTLLYRYKTEYDRKKLLRCVESAIIQEINGHPRCKLANVSQTASANIYYRIKIKNIGNKGILPAEIIFDADNIYIET